MNFKLVFHLAGKTLLVEAICMVLPLAVALLYQEDPMPFLLAIGITATSGFLLSLLKSDPTFHAREGFFSAGLIWILASICGALPFYFCGAFASFVDFFFEAISGFTTTGASVLTAVEGCPYGLLFWRSFTNWVGGMGVLVFIMAVLPLADDRSMHIMRAEVPGPVVGKLVPKARQSAMILYGIYVVISILEVVFLLAGGMPLYDALVSTFATAGTGGFSVKNASIAGYNSPYAEYVISVFLLLFSINVVSISFSYLRISTCSGVGSGVIFFLPTWLKNTRIPNAIPIE